MLSEIEINNFRCFEQTKISGFERINLISGKNNSGKTALLEALFLNASPRVAHIMFLRQVRRESLIFSQVVPERAWQTFFLNPDKKASIKISFKILISTLQVRYILLENALYYSPEELMDNESLETSIFPSNNYTNSVLTIKLINPDREITLNDINRNIIIEGGRNTIGKGGRNTIGEGGRNTIGDSINKLMPGFNEEEELRHLTIIASPTGLNYQGNNIPELRPVFFIPSFLRTKNQELTEEYDKARLNDKAEEILAAFKIIDPSIQTVESFSIGEPTIYLKREGEKRLPLSLFGDALNRVADIILRIVNNRQSILLIDEIENGIHHTNQREFWQMLFRLAVELDIQIFATTHSLEMLQAFVDVGKETQNIAAHFELVRNPKTQQISGIKRDVETLEYGIKRQKGVRGE